MWSFTKGTNTLALPGSRAHGPARVVHRVQQHVARQPRHQPGHAVHQLDLRGAAQLSSTGSSGWSRAPTCRGPCPRSAGSASSPSPPGWATRSPAGGSPSWSASRSSPSASSATGQDSIDLLIVTGMAVAHRGPDRDAARGPDRHQPARQQGRSRSSSTSCRRCRPSSTSCRSCCSSASASAARSSRPSSTPSRRWCGSPASGSGRCRPPRSRPPTRPGRPTGSGCSRCSSRWRARPSSSASTRPRWPRCRWRPSRRTSTGPGSASRCSTRSSPTTSAAASCPGVLIVVMAVMLDRTTTAASERSEKVARGGGGNLRLRRIMLGGRGRGRAGGGLPVARLTWPGRVPRVHDRRQGRHAADDVMDWFVDIFGGVGRRVQGRHHRLVPQPDAVAAGRVAVVALRPRRSPRWPWSSAVSGRW